MGEWFKGGYDSVEGFSLWPDEFVVEEGVKDHGDCEGHGESDKDREGCLEGFEGVQGEEGSGEGGEEKSRARENVKDDSVHGEDGESAVQVSRDEG